jgi:hypothetical protein
MKQKSKWANDRTFLLVYRVGCAPRNRAKHFSLENAVLLKQQHSAQVNKVGGAVEATFAAVDLFISRVPQSPERVGADSGGDKRRAGAARTAPPEEHHNAAAAIDFAMCRSGGN